MRDLSIFQGWKQLSKDGIAFRFTKTGIFKVNRSYAIWAVYRQNIDGAFEFVGHVQTFLKVSNTKLFDTAYQYFG